MQFSKAFVAAALAASASARCVYDAAECAEFPEVDASMVRYASDYTWEWVKTTSADGYDLRMIRFTGNENGNKLPGQGRLGPVLWLHGGKADCA